MLTAMGIQAKVCTIKSHLCVRWKTPSSNVTIQMQILRTTLNNFELDTLE